jgi:hypothetical protein
LYTVGKRLDLQQMDPSVSSSLTTVFHPRGACLHDFLTTGPGEFDLEGFTVAFRSIVALQAKGVYSYVLRTVPISYMPCSCWAQESQENPLRALSYTVALTPKDRSNTCFVAHVLMGIYPSSGLTVVQSNIPPHLMKFFACHDWTEHIDYINTWKHNKKELTELGIPHYSTLDDNHPPGRCREDCEWPESKKIIDSYRNKQSTQCNYALYRGKDDKPFAQVFESPCVYFDHLVDCSELTAKNRSDPCFVAWIDMNDPTDFYIEESVSADLVCFEVHDGKEYINHTQISAYGEQSTLARCAQVEN